MMDLSPLPPPWAGHLHTSLELAATLAFALSGVIDAARKRLDMVGVAVVAFAAAFGGGTLRDLLLDYRPFFWASQPLFPWSVALLCVAAMLFMRQRHWQPTERAILWPDAIGLGLFTATGVERALALQQPMLVAVLMGVVTSVFGGVLRDVLCNRVPRALSDHRPYALWALLGGWLCWLMREPLGLPPWLAMTATVLLTAALRLLSVYRDWRLPAWRT